MEKKRWKRDTRLFQILETGGKKKQKNVSSGYAWVRVIHSFFPLSVLGFVFVLFCCHSYNLSIL